MKRHLLYISSIFCLQICQGYELAHVAKTIKEEYCAKEVRTDFADKLFREVAAATDDFTKNLTCNDLQQFINQDYLDFMSLKATEYNPNIFIALVWPVVEEKDALLIEHFEEYFNVIGHKRILLDEKGARNFLSQIPGKASHPTGVELWFAPPFRNYNPMRAFLLECKQNDTDYEEMKGYLVKIFSNNQSYIDDFEAKHGQRAIQNLYCATVCKRKIRKAVKIDYALHITDEPKEALEIAQIVFNNRSLDCVKHSQYQNARGFSRFNHFMRELKHAANSMLNDIVVYNSAVLSAYGLRDCSDIDFFHDPRVFISHNFHPDLSNQNRFFPRNYVIVEDLKGKHYILEDCPNAFADEDLDATPLLSKRISIDELLYNPLKHFYYHGVRFASLDFMLYFKGKRGRPKDLNDVRLIKEHYINR